MECKPRSALLRSQAEHGWHSSPDGQCELTIPAQPNLSTDVFPCVKSLIYRWENKKAAVSSKAKKTKKKKKKKKSPTTTPGAHQPSFSIQLRLPPRHKSLEPSPSSHHQHQHIDHPAPLNFFFLRTRRDRNHLPARTININTSTILLR